MDLMLKAIFHISKMDCPSEEQMIRMKLSDYDSIQHLDFVIQDRKLTVMHLGNSTEILNLLEELKLDTKLVSESKTTESINYSKDSKKERKLLWAVLLINFSFFVIEILFGWFSRSMGLVADSLDMLADAGVYVISFYAVGKLVQKKIVAAKVSG